MGQVLKNISIIMIRDCMGRFTDVIGGVGIEVLASGLSVGIANVSTSPLDMIKVRMQSGEGLPEYERLEASTSPHAKLQYKNR